MIHLERKDSEIKTYETKGLPNSTLKSVVAPIINALRAVGLKEIVNKVYERVYEKLPQAEKQSLSDDQRSGLMSLFEEDIKVTSKVLEKEGVTLRW